jgi:hypothetical protein
MTEGSGKQVRRRLSLAERPIVLALGLGVLGGAFHLIQIYREFEHLKHALTGYPGLGNLHTAFILAFFLCLVGLVLRSRPGLILSILSLTSVVLLYVVWYKTSYREWRLIWEFSPSPEFIPSHPLGLLYASWLDIAILFAVIAVLAWQIKFLIGTFRYSNESK